MPRLIDPPCPGGAVRWTAQSTNETNSAAGSPDAVDLENHSFADVSMRGVGSTQKARVMACVLQRAVTSRTHEEVDLWKVARGPVWKFAAHLKENKDGKSR